MANANIYRLYSFARLVPQGVDDGQDSCFTAGYSTVVDGAVYLHDRLPYWTVGRGKALNQPCDVPITGSKTAASSLHAMIYRRKDASGAEKIFLKSLTDTSTTWVDGEEVSKGSSVVLSNCAEIWLGHMGVNNSAGFIIKDLFVSRPFIRDFSYEVMLGSGGYGEVHKVHKRNNPSRKYAVKVLDFGRPGANISKHTARKELVIVKALLKHVHPHVAGLEAIYDDVDQSGMYLYVMEYFPLGDLHHLLLSRAEPAGLCDIQVIIKQTCEGLLFLHDNLILHRDLKLLNVLVRSASPWSVAVGDFGVSKRLVRGAERVKSVVGTPVYVAPEVFLDPMGYDSKAEVYSAGVILFVLLGGDLDAKPYKLPDRSVSDTEYAKLRVLKWDQLNWRNLSARADVMVLVKAMLHPDPSERWSIAQVLQSPWLRTAPSVRREDLKAGRTQVDALPSVPLSTLLDEIRTAQVAQKIDVHQSSLQIPLPTPVEVPSPAPGRLSKPTTPSRIPLKTQTLPRKSLLHGGMLPVQTSSSMAPLAHIAANVGVQLAGAVEAGSSRIPRPVMITPRRSLRIEVLALARDEKEREKDKQRGTEGNGKESQREKEKGRPKPKPRPVGRRKAKKSVEVCPREPSDLDSKKDKGVL